ncbi:MAG TPA: hypothetical protein VMM13_07765 [Euzebya sp.]|nr:hypothetical protein [Euzebya sp.]
MDTTQGKPAQLLIQLAAAGVRVDAGCMFPRTEGRVVHIAVEDHHVETVRAAALELSAAVVDDRECVVVPADHPGGVAEIAARVAEAGATVQVAYFGRGGEIILATTDLEEVREGLGI